jgi:hypothetical protein
MQCCSRVRHPVVTIKCVDVRNPKNPKLGDLEAVSLDWLFIQVVLSDG